MNRPKTLHVYSQYLWPDDAPTGIYAEQVADAVASAGVPVRLIGGRGHYRAGRRARPQTPIQRVAHAVGQRGVLTSTAHEYTSIRWAFGKDISSHVKQGDVVLVTSAPPTTIFLEKAIRKRGARSVYWLQDYYPELIRGVWNVPYPFSRGFGRYWSHRLKKWDHVVKAAGNLGYEGPNALVIRNWNTVQLGVPMPFVRRTALYAGNLGYGHDVNEFVALCRRLHEDEVDITVRGDGPGMAHLPDWICRAPLLIDPEELARAYWRAETHLIAGHPQITAAVFPSKFWNAHATGRPVLVSGFAGAMADELSYARRCDYSRHLSEWTRFLVGLFDAQG